jgi:hypothetical protein
VIYVVDQTKPDDQLCAMAGFLVAKAADVLGDILALANIALENSVVLGDLSIDVLIPPLQLVDLDDDVIQLLWQGVAENALAFVIDNLVDIDAIAYAQESVFCALKEKKAANFDGLGPEILRQAAIKGPAYEGAIAIVEAGLSGSLLSFYNAVTVNSINQIASYIDGEAVGVLILGWIVGQEFQANLTGRGLDEYLAEYSNRIAAGSDACADFDCIEPVADCNNETNLWESATAFVNKGGGNANEVFGGVSPGVTSWNAWDLESYQGTLHTIRSVPVGPVTFNRVTLVGVNAIAGFDDGGNNYLKPFRVAVYAGATEGSAVLVYDSLSEIYDWTTDIQKISFDIPGGVTAAEYIRLEFSYGGIASYWIISGILLCNV